MAKLTPYRSYSQVFAMKTVSSTEIKNRLGQYLEASVAQPVVVEKAGRPVSVVLSYAEYQRLVAIEDSYWLARAKQAEESGYLGAEESMAFLKGNIGAGSKAD